MQRRRKNTERTRTCSRWKTAAVAGVRLDAGTARLAASTRRKVRRPLSALRHRLQPRPTRRSRSASTRATTPTPTPTRRPRRRPPQLMEARRRAAATEPRATKSRTNRRRSLRYLFPLVTTSILDWSRATSSTALILGSRVRYYQTLVGCLLTTPPERVGAVDEQVVHRGVQPVLKGGLSEFVLVLPERERSGM